MGNEKRWITVEISSTNNDTGCGLMLVVPSNKEQRQALGKQGGEESMAIPILEWLLE